MTEINNNELVGDGLERVADAARFLGLSRSMVYKLIDAGELPSVKLGNARRIPIRAVRGLAADRLVCHPRSDER